MAKKVASPDPFNSFMSRFSKKSAGKPAPSAPTKKKKPAFGKPKGKPSIPPAQPGGKDVFSQLATKYAWSQGIRGKGGSPSASV